MDTWVAASSLVHSAKRQGEIADDAERAAAKTSDPEAAAALRRVARALRSHEHLTTALAEVLQAVETAKREA